VLTHVVLFKLKDRDAAKIEEARHMLEKLREGIPTLRSLEVGANVTHSARSYDLALITRFDDLAGYQVYREHPVHLPVLDYLREAVEVSVMVDFES
jgi:hypothetical protein